MMISSPELPNDDFRQALWQSMKLARRNIETLVSGLERLGYRFGFFEEGWPIVGYGEPWISPPLDIKTLLLEAQRITGPWPIALITWYEIVGSVDFRGYHPEWNADYPDPIVVEFMGLEYIAQEYQEWSEVTDRSAGNAAPFCLDIAPDFYHKANVSGGPPYCIALPDGSFDTPLLNEPNDTTFLGYLKLCFQWGGFPGLENIELNPLLRSHLTFLKEGLIII